jgi:hypothetical protein
MLAKATSAVQILLKFLPSRPYDEKGVRENNLVSVVEALELQPGVSTAGVVFALSLCGRDIACVVTLEISRICSLLRVSVEWLCEGDSDARSPETGKCRRERV